MDREYLGASDFFLGGGCSNLRSKESKTPSPSKKLMVSLISFEWDSWFVEVVGRGAGGDGGGGVRGTWITWRGLIGFVCGR